MEKKFNHLKRLFPVIIFTGLLLTSCEDFLNTKHNGYSNSVVSLGFVKTNTTDQTFVINLDNGSVLTPDIKASSSVGVRDSERVWVRFNTDHYSQINDSTKNYYSRIYDINEVLYKNVKKTTELSADSAGHDPILVRDAWISPKNILNIDFKFYTSGSIHYINLLQSAVGDGINQPIVLEFHHNARGDASSYLVSGLASFNLNSIKVQGQHSLKFVIRYTDYQGNQIDMPRTFTY